MVVRRDAFHVALRRLVWFGHLSVLHCSGALPKISTQTVNMCTLRGLSWTLEKSNCVLYLLLREEEGFTSSVELPGCWWDEIDQGEPISRWVAGQMKVMPRCVLTSSPICAIWSWFDAVSGRLIFTWKHICICNKSEHVYVLITHTQLHVLKQSKTTV